MVGEVSTMVQQATGKIGKKGTRQKLNKWVKEHIPIDRDNIFNGKLEVRNIGRIIVNPETEEDLWLVREL